MSFSYLLIPVDGDVVAQCDGDDDKNDGHYDQYKNRGYDNDHRDKADENDHYDD